MNFVGAATRLVGKGFSVFPLIPGGKTPLIEGYFDASTSDLEWITSHWSRVEGCNVGIAMKGFVGIDIDRKNGRDGMEWVLEMKAQGNLWPETYIQKTPTGGLHLVYSVPSDIRIGNSASRLGVGVDIRGQNSSGYLVGSGSRTEIGTYTDNGRDCAEAPAWLLEKIKTTITPQAPREERTEVDEVAAKRRGIEWVQHQEGYAAGRNERNYQLATRLKNMGVNEDDATEILCEHWAPRCTPPYPPEKVKEIVTNGYNYAKEKDPILAPEHVFDELPIPPEDIARKEEAFDFFKDCAYMIKGGRDCVLWKTTDPFGKPTIIELLPETFHNRFISKKKKVEINGKLKVVQLSREWFYSPDRKEYNGYVFDPSRKCTDKYYNTFQGFNVQPLAKGVEPSPRAKSSVDKFVEHITENVCLGNKEHAHWVMSWFAQIFQRPWDRPDVALVLKGKKGTGKSAPMDRIGYLLGKMYLADANKRTFASNFNKHLEKLLLYGMEESFWGGHKDIESILKHLVTGKKKLIEPKGKESYEVTNFTRHMILGNDDWIIPASQDERRFAVFEMGEDRMQDGDFFESMRVDMEEHGGAEYFLRYLLDYDISGVNLNRAPKTAALSQQQERSYNHYQSWWYAGLEMGEIDGIAFMEGGWPRSVFRQEMYRSFLKWKQIHFPRSNYNLTESEFGKKLREMCPEVGSKSLRQENSRIRTYELPTLEVARKSWEKLHRGSPINWDDGEIEDEKEDKEKDDKESSPSKEGTTGKESLAGKDNASQDKEGSPPGKEGTNGKGTSRTVEPSAENGSGLAVGRVRPEMEEDPPDTIPLPDDLDKTVRKEVPFG